MTVHIIGNSHTAALEDGRREFGLQNKNIKVFRLGSGVTETQPFSEVRGDHVEFTSPGYRRHFSAYATGTAIDKTYVIGLLMGTHNARILRAGRRRRDGDIVRKSFWATAAPAHLGLPDMRPVSAGVLDAIVDEDQQHIRHFIRHVLEVGGRIFAVSCAPLRRDGDFAEVSPEVALAVDQHARRRFTTWLENNGVSFVAPPEETVDEDGFLLPQYARTETAEGTPDPHHGNAAYGALMYKEIERFVERRLRVSTNG